MKRFVGIVLLVAVASTQGFKFELTVDYFMSTLECFYDANKCDPKTLEYKDYIVDLFQTHCEKCAKDELKAIRAIDDILDKEEYKGVKEKFDSVYDPEHKFRGPFRKYLEENS